jgi:hypothetical protein
MEGLDNLTDFLMIDLEFCDKLISILENGNWNVYEWTTHKHLNSDSKGLDS